MEDVPSNDICHMEGISKNSASNKKLLLLDSPLIVLQKRDLGTKIGHLENECESESIQAPPEEQLAAMGEVVPEPIFNHGFEDGEGELNPPRKRSSSLKGPRSVPTSPGVSKVVHFADAMGLDLAFVKKIINSDDPPIIPKSALIDLHVDRPLSNVLSASQELTSFSVSHRTLSQKFVLPALSPDFLKQLCERKVMLESCAVDNTDMSISGTVRVANVDYHKSVTVRYSFNNWLTQDELQATYVCNSCDGPTDRFSFTISLPESIEGGMCVQFALKYQVGSNSFWDNNFGANYIIQCLSSEESSDNY